MEISLIAGLGNPGARYACTRHNAGFMLLDRLADRLKADPWRNWQSLGDYAKVQCPQGTLFLLKPNTYMNNSGDALQSFASFHRLEPGKILVCFDDISLDAGRIRLRRAGSDGGQRGMRDILGKLGGQNIPRLRIGVGPRPEQIQAKDFVLAPPSSEQRAAFEDGLKSAEAAVLAVLERGLEAAMNAANGGAKP